MALVTEDGTGLSNAESYLSVSDCDAYHSARANSVWGAAETADKEAALRKATEFLDATFTWYGYIKSDSQRLGWPRWNVWDKEGRGITDMVPPGVENATAELALAALSSDLVPNKTNADYAIREKVGPLEVEYKERAPSSPQYVLATRLLKGLYSRSSAVSPMSMEMSRA